jgi:hypothetical protein
MAEGETSYADAVHRFTALLAFSTQANDSDSEAPVARGAGLSLDSWFSKRVVRVYHHARLPPSSGFHSMAFP